MTKLRQAAWTAIHKINRSIGFDEESDNLLMEAASVLREALDHSGEVNKMVAEQTEQEPVVKYYGEKLVKGSKVFALIDRDLAPDTLLYAAPVRTKDLTDDEIDGVMWIGGLTQKNIRKFARAVIAADRSKNK